MFNKIRRNRMIKRGIAQTVEQFRDSCPHISRHFYYGAVEYGAENLVIWYLFKTDAELETAKQNGLCDRIEETTVSHLLRFGYPADAFVEKVVELPPQITFANGTAAQQQAIIDQLTHRKARIAFTTEEDIENKTHGDDRLYFQ